MELINKVDLDDKLGKLANDEDLEIFVCENGEHTPYIIGEGIESLNCCPICGETVEIYLETHVGVHSDGCDEECEIMKVGQDEDLRVVHRTPKNMTTLRPNKEAIEVAILVRKQKGSYYGQLLYEKEN